MEREHLTQLREILTNRFDEGELRTLCFDLGVDYDILPGESKADKARELVAFLERRQRLDELFQVGPRLRPDILWPEKDGGGPPPAAPGTSSERRAKKVVKVGGVKALGCSARTVILFLGLAFIIACGIIIVSIAKSKREINATQTATAIAGHSSATAALPSTPTRAPTFTPAPTIVATETVALLTFHNQYVTALNDEPGRDWQLRGAAAEIKDWEKFTLLCLDNGQVALETRHGRYVTAMDGGYDPPWVLRAETQALLGSEMFTLVNVETEKDMPCLEVFESLEHDEVKMALKTAHDRYVTATDGGYDPPWVLRAETRELNDWEKFTLVPLQRLTRPPTPETYNTTPACAKPTFVVVYQI
jgi:hypothetical protein